MTPPIHDITDPGEFLPGPQPFWHLWWFWLAIAAGIVMLGIILYAIKCKHSVTRQRRSLLDKAKKRLRVLKSELGNMEPQNAAVRISLILRQYLEAAFNDPALFETIEEFTLRPHALAKLHPECREAVTDHLNELSRLKYFPKGEREQILCLIDQAGDILNRIGQTLETTGTSLSK